MRGKKGWYTFRLWFKPFVTVQAASRKEAKEWYRSLLGAGWRQGWEEYYGVRKATGEMIGFI